MDQNSDQWDLTSLANSDTDIKLQDARQKAQNAINEFVQKWLHNDSYVSNPQQLLLALQDYEKLMAHHGLNGNEWYYFSLRSAQDQVNPQLKGLARSADEIATKQYNQIQLFPLNISKIKAELQEEILINPEFKEYRHYLKRLFDQQKFLLTEPEEKILNLTSQSSHSAWVSMTSSFLSKEQAILKHEDGTDKSTTFTEMMSLSSSQNKQVRDQAAMKVDKIMEKYVPTATEEINAILQFKKITDELRGYTRPDQERHLSDDIESSVVDSLVAAVGSKFYIANDYYQLKAKLMGVDRLAYHERNVPFGNLDQEYSYEQSTKLVGDCLANLDKEFGSIFSSFVNQQQFDVYPRPGKAGGAFCAHNLITQPSYILLNHTNKLQDVLTMAHEMGHGLHNEMARQSQNALNFGTSLATAEVASTFMEDFVMEKLLEKADKHTQLSVMMMKLNDDISSIFRQIACYQFEQQLHQQFAEKGYLSEEEIGKIFQEHMVAYMGPYVEQSYGSQNWWVYWSHIRNFFYVYSYASGLLISKSLQALVRENPTNIAKVKQFMAAGQSDSPRNIFLNAGIDIQQANFWDQGLGEIKDLLQKTTNLAKELNLIK